MLNKTHDPTSPLVPQAYNTTAGVSPITNLQSQLQNLQLLATQLGYHLQPVNPPVPPTSVLGQPPPQAYFAPRSFNNNRGSRRGNSRGNSRGQSNNSRGRDNPSQNRQFGWASTQNTVYGHCNRCGIGHLPTQCPSQSGSSRSSNQANFATYSDGGSTYEAWKPDTGANGHASPDLASLDNFEAYHGNDSLHVGDGTPLPIFHIDSKTFFTPHKTFNLSNILHVPALKQNLLYVQKFCSDNDVFFEFHSSFFVVEDESTRTTLLTGPSEQGLYTIRLPHLKSLPKVAFTAVKESSTIWHHRLGHPHRRVLQSIISSYSLPVSTKLSSCLCTSCQLAKSSKLPLKLSTFHSSNILDLVYCDVWGPSSTLSLDGYRYFLLCVDHHSRYMWFYPLAQKSDVYSTLKNFITMVERQFNTKLKTIQTDWGGEFRNLTPYVTSLGIIHQRSCPHTSEQNGIVERRHRHVVETGLALLAHSNLPQRFWSFAFETATYLINRLPSRTSSNTSPFLHIFHRKPDYSFLRVFGCQCFPYLRPYTHHKIDFRSTPCIFLGYSPFHHGYRCFDPVTERVYVVMFASMNMFFRIVTLHNPLLFLQSIPQFFLNRHPHSTLHSPLPFSQPPLQLFRHLSSLHSLTSRLPHRLSNLSLQPLLNLSHLSSLHIHHSLPSNLYPLRHLLLLLHLGPALPIYALTRNLLIVSALRPIILTLPLIHLSNLLLLPLLTSHRSGVLP
ncbi:putative RNA-directed DNA polymerase [Helianthus anomalus]